MKASSRSLVLPVMTIGLILATALIIAIILLGANLTIINAQQVTNQPLAVTQNGTTLFESAEDSFRLQVPEDWVIYDVNNTGSRFSEESRQGYGILAQLCPQEQQQQQQRVVSNAVANGSDPFSSCDQSENDIIHIIRYPDLDARLQVPNNTTTNSSDLTVDNILSYHMQNLEEVGYSIIETVNGTDTTLNIINPQTNQTISTIPAKNIGMTYSTSLAPNQTRTGYFVLTATDATAPNQGMTKGYSIFYEGNSANTSETTTTPSASLARTSLPAPARQVFDSFELIAATAPIEPLSVEITSDAEEGDIAPATFEFEADVAGGTAPYTYSWDFDDDDDDEDSGEDDEQTVLHTFEEAGSYDVDLTVTDSGGQNASDSIEVTVEEAPVEEIIEEEIIVEEEEEPSLAEEIIEEEIIVEEEEEEPSLAEEAEEGDGADSDIDGELPAATDEEGEDNNLSSDDLFDVDDIFDVDEFIDDLFDKLGLNN